MWKTNTFVLILLLAIGCSEAKILVSIPDLKNIAEKISDEKVESIIPSSVDPHYISISYQELRKVENAKIVLLANSELIGFEAEIKNVCGDKCLDFKEYNATLLDFRGIGYNPHAYWLLPENALKIALTLKNKLIELHPDKSEEYDRNYENFRKEMENAKIFAKEIVSKVQDYDFIAMDPHVAYAISAVQLQVSMAFPEDLTLSMHEIGEVKESKCVLVIAEYHEKTKLEEIAKQIALEKKCKISKVKILSNMSPEAQLISNSVLLANPNYPNSEDLGLFYLISIIAVAEAIALVVLWQSKRKI
ncbi:MAG: zinc ABC transporter substrate-binding protein [Archaeoglobaceae archaeon]|nr:zinc ABC transporter substrate-binding protein [Archaeoglobaceae archaeon]MDW8117971.1 zinc ABC transporter substrate-binding protein [Archaeoglobaceae archaeon]